MFIVVAFLTPMGPITLGEKAKDDGRHIKALTAKVFKRIVFNRSRYAYLYKGVVEGAAEARETDECVFR
jgi:hypothetical protein